MDLFNSPIGANIISALALITSVFSLAWSYNQAKSQQGQLEYTIRQHLTQTRQRVDDLGVHSKISSFS